MIVVTTIVLVQLGRVQTTDLQEACGSVLVARLEQLLRMVAIDRFSIVERVGIVLNGQSQPALIGHKVGP